MRRDRRRQLLRGAVGFAIGFGGALTTIYAVGYLAGRDAGGPVELGGLDIQGYCARDEGMESLLLSPDAYGWLCVGAPDRVWVTREIDVYDVCRWQYGDPDAYAVLRDAEDAGGWRCVRDP